FNSKKKPQQDDWELNDDDDFEEQQDILEGYTYEKQEKEKSKGASGASSPIVHLSTHKSSAQSNDVTDELSNDHSPVDEYDWIEGQSSAVDEQGDYQSQEHDYLDQEVAAGDDIPAQAD